MIRLSKKADYSLTALKHILSKENEPSSAREIAQACGIPFEVLAKLLQKLARKGFLISQYGTKGGYSPARGPGSITVRDVLEAIEVPLAVLEYSKPRNGLCDRETSCTVKRPLALVEQKVLDLLGRTTLREI